MKKTKRFGIRTRLFMVFGVLSALTISASIVAWVSYNRLGSELNRLAEENISALRLMADLKERGATITILAPTLLAVNNQQTRLKIGQQLDFNISTMMGLLPSLSELTQSAQVIAKPKLAAQINQLQTTMQHLDDNVLRRLEVQGQKLSDNQRLRWAAAVFLSEIDTLLQVIHHKLYGRFDQKIPVQGINWSNVDKSIISALSADIQALYRIKADMNLLINLVDRAQYLPDLNSLVAINIHSGEVVQGIMSDFALIDNVSGITSGVNALKQSILSIVSLTQGDSNIFTLRREERQIIAYGEQLLMQVHLDLIGFNQLIKAEVNLVEHAAQTSVKNARQTIKKGRIWLVAMVGISLLFSGLIIWLYVGRNMVARITLLDSSMRSIANGNLNQQVPVKGRDEIGAMARSLMSFRDQLSTLQEELVQAGKLAALGQLSAGIAHEINQPLSAIGHYSHNGLRLIDAQRYSETADNLRQISNLTKRATTIITRLKAMGRKQSSSLVLVDLKTVIDNVLAMLEGDKIRQLSDIQVELAKGASQVMAEPIQLEQVILNLVTNALDAIADSGKKLIKISAETTIDSVEIYVTDSGTGVDEQSKKQIFDPFFTTKRRTANLGLGLSISFNIIQDFGGKLSIDTPEEGGACFCIALPKGGTI